MLCRTRVLLLLAASLACAVGVTAAQPQIFKWTIDGVQREALVFAPSRHSATGKSPLVFAFHPHGGTMQQAAEGMRFQDLWPQAIVVYMQGLRTRIYVDPLGLEAGWQSEPGQYGDRDLNFFDAVLATIRQNFSADDDRVYSTGFSNGGIFTYVLWGARANVFAAFAPAAAQIFPGVHLSTPRPLLQIAGRADTVVPYNEQLQAIQIARTLDGTDEKGSRCGQDCTMYSSSTGVPVITYLHAGGHVYPPGASEMIVNFFKKQARSAEPATPRS